VLLTATADDPWIAPSQAARMAARLQAANPGGRPVWLRIDDAAHDAGTRERHDEDLADIFSFVFAEFAR
jgi:prolyl oligopeptidase